MSATDVSTHADEIFAFHLAVVQKRTDRVFAILFVLQWAFAIGCALIIAPQTWMGDETSVHVHVWAGILLGGLLSAAPITLALTKPGWVGTRMTVAVAQMLYSSLLIHLTGGRIETHFHVFGSLAFLAFYRDWRVLVPATIVVAADHLIRGIFWPESVFGVLVAAPWRALEHAGWVIFEVVFLIWSSITSVREMRDTAAAQAALEAAMLAIEEQVEQRTEQLQERTHALESEMNKSRTLEVQLLQAQKLESIGQLAAGIAHEINTPMQFVNDNVEFVGACLDKFLAVFDHLAENLSETAQPMPWKERQAIMRNVIQENRFERIREQMPLAIAESKEGIDRVIHVVRAMKEFSHPGREDKVAADLNQAIESTVTISRNRWKFVADLNLDLDVNLPRVECLPAEINQVLLNLVVNAADAIAEKNGNSGKRGVITVRTRCDENDAVIVVEDTGSGIPDEVRNRIFDPFFTTKDVGKGTGQGLAICYNVVVTKHCGTIEVESTPGVGSQFIVRIPLEVCRRDHDEDEDLAVAAAESDAPEGIIW